MLISALDNDVIEGSENCISAYDKEMRIIIWNKACEKTFGIPKEKALRQSLFSLFPHIEDDYRVSCMRQCLKEGKSFSFSKQPYRFSKGYYSQKIEPLTDENNSIIGIISTVAHLGELEIQ